MGISWFNEALNGLLFALLTYVIVILARYCWFARHDGYEALRPALVLGTFLVGEAVIRATFWWTRHQVNMGEPVPDYYLAAIIGLGICIAGVVWIIRFFSPDECGPGSWWWGIVWAFTWTFGWMYFDQIF